MTFQSPSIVIQLPLYLQALPEGKKRQTNKNQGQSTCREKKKEKKENTAVEEKLWNGRNTGQEDSAVVGGRSLSGEPERTRNVGPPMLHTSRITECIKHQYHHPYNSLLLRHTNDSYPQMVFEASVFKHAHRISRVYSNSYSDFQFREKMYLLQNWSYFNYHVRVSLKVLVDQFLFLFVIK